MIKEFFRQSKFVISIYYGCRIDCFIAKNGLFGFDKKINNAIDGEFSLGRLQGVDLAELKKDIKSCYVKYKALPREYFLFDFIHKTDAERATYVTDTYINSTLGRLVGRKYHDEQLNDKYNFYKIMKPYFKRKVIRVRSPKDYNKFEAFALDCKSLIIKPNNSSVGNGIFATIIKNSDDAKNVFSKMMINGKSWIVEEMLSQTEDMAKWNKSSVNTVRVSAFLNKKGFFVLSSVIRTGREGSVIDNAGHGGISAAIDVNTGEIISDGMGKDGNWYVCHPDSKTPFKGIVIPCWKELIETVEKVHKMLPNHIYVGWDFALTPKGWALIEGNWGQLGAQQFALGHGLKPMFDKYLSYGVL